MWHFNMNGYEWEVLLVDKNSPYLIDRTGRLTVATTDPSTQTIYISNALSKDFLIRVLVHELGHATMFSYYLVDDIHRMTHPKYWMDIEEWTCNFISDYGQKIFEVLKELYFG